MTKPLGDPDRWLEAKACIRQRKHLARYRVEHWHEWKEQSVELGCGVGALRTFIGAWNLHGKQAPADLSPWVRKDIFHHIYVLGTAECDRGIGESMVFSSKRRWEQQVAQHLGDEYAMIKAETLAATHIMVFMIASLVKVVRNIRAAHVPTGIGNVLGNKGATEVCFTLGTTSFLFISAHLASGMKKTDLRTQSFQRILRDRQISRGAPVFDTFDHIFFFGDLNYRLQTSRDNAVEWVRVGNHRNLLLVDQLLRQRHINEPIVSVFGREHSPVRTRASVASMISDAELSSDSSCGEEDGSGAKTDEDGEASRRAKDKSKENGASKVDGATPAPHLSTAEIPSKRQSVTGDTIQWTEFSEMAIEFPPTYKFDVGTEVYDTSDKQRVPAYTDRILWKTNPGVTALAYDSIKSFLGSDHRPIFAQFELEVNFDTEKPTPRGQEQSASCVVM